jgi:hypothetical protein
VCSRAVLKTAANRVPFSVLAQLGGLECNGLGKHRLGALSESGADLSGSIRSGLCRRHVDYKGLEFYHQH